MERKWRYSRNLNSEESSEAEKKSHSKNVHFAEHPVKSASLRKKHQSNSILKKKKTLPQFQNYKIRSDSVNSLAGQSPKDDQSCQNSSVNKASKEQYLRTAEMCSEKDKFKDRFFPPNSSSLFSGRKTMKELKIREIKWKRVTELFPGRNLVIMSPETWKNFIQPSTRFAADYFSLALNCLKNNKTVLKKIFQGCRVNSQGIYCLKIFQGNVWKSVTIDDFIPVFEEKDKKGNKYTPIFVKGQVSQSRTQHIEIWPYLLQKAYAKYYSSYETLQYGNVLDFLEELTNQTREEIKLTKVKLDLKELFKQNDLITVGQQFNGALTPIFSTIGTSQKIVFLSSQKPGYKNTIVPEDLPKIFSHIYVYGLRKYSYCGFCPIRQIKQSVSIRSFELKQSARCSLTIFQRDERLFKDKTDYEYSWIRVVVLQKEYQEGYRWIDGRYCKTKSITFQSDLQAGEYYVLVVPEWNFKTYDLNFILRTKVPTQIERKIYSEGIFEEGCADLAQRFGKMNQINAYICSYNCIHDDLALIIENINNEKTKGNVRVKRSMQALHTSLPIVPLNKEFKGKKSLEITIKSNCHYTVVLMMKGGIDRKFFQNFDFCSKQ